MKKIIFLILFLFSSISYAEEKYAANLKTRNDLTELKIKENQKKFYTEKKKFKKPKGSNNDLMRSSVNSPFLKMELRDRGVQDEPINITTNSTLNKKAVLEFGFKAENYFSVYLRSDVADVSYSLDQQNNRLNIQLNNQISNVKVGFSYNF